MVVQPQGLRFRLVLAVVGVSPLCLTVGDTRHVGVIVIGVADVGGVAVAEIFMLKVTGVVIGQVDFVKLSGRRTTGLFTVGALCVPDDLADMIIGVGVFARVRTIGLTQPFIVVVITVFSQASLADGGDVAKQVDVDVGGDTVGRFDFGGGLVGGAAIGVERGGGTVTPVIGRLTFVALKVGVADTAVNRRLAEGFLPLQAC